MLGDPAWRRVGREDWIESYTVVISFKDIVSSYALKPMYLMCISIKLLISEYLLINKWVPLNLVITLGRQIYVFISEFQKPKPPVQVDSTDEVKRRKRRRPVGDIIKEYEGQNKHYMGK